MKKLLLLLLGLVPVVATGQISELSDEFDKTCDLENWINIEDTEGWTNTHLEQYDINQTNQGQLTMIPWTTAWYASRRSNLLYKNISGDFILTTEVNATNKLENDQPGGAYSLAGMMIRTPKVMGANGPIGDENYVFLSLGSASSNNNPQFEVKSTIDSDSELTIYNISSTTAQIRMVRVNGDIIVLHRVEGEEWFIRRRYDRTDMPDSVQVGFVTYTDWDKVLTYSIPFHNENTLNADLDPDPSNNNGQAFNPDIIGKFEFARFDEVTLPVGYENGDFSNAGSVPDNIILQTYGYESISTGLEGWKIWEGANNNWSETTNWKGGVLPMNQDSILIPNCGCPEVVFPELASGNFSYSSLIIEEGGQLNIPSGSTLNIDLAGNESRLINQGNVTIHGDLNLLNPVGKQVLNEGELQVMSGGQTNIGN